MSWKTIVWLNLEWHSYKCVAYEISHNDIILCIICIHVTDSNIVDEIANAHFYIYSISIKLIRELYPMPYTQNKKNDDLNGFLSCCDITSIMCVT